MREMTRLSELAKRVASMPVTEAVDRSRQAGWRAAGRLGLTRGLPALRRRPSSRRVMFPALLDPEGTAEAFRRRSPEGVERIVRRADHILEGRFPLLGFGGLEFGDPVDWHLDPVHGRRAPRIHFSRIDPLDADSVGDHKIIWELNRHTFLLPLSRAYLLTGDERYAARALHLIRHWIEENPVEEGINWHSSLEVALRLLSWLQVWPAFAHLSLFDDLRSEWLASIDRQALHVSRFLSHHFAPNTHLTGEALALVTVGMLFPGLPRAARYRRLGRRVLDREMDRQLLADGFHYERSAAYHRYTVEYLLVDLLASSLNGVEDVRHEEARLATAVEAMLPLVRPDGRLVNVGDEDGGRLLQVDGENPLDARTLVACAAIVLDRGDLKATLPGLPADVVWILGPGAHRRWETLPGDDPPETSHALPDAGYVAMRDGWGDEADYALLDAGPMGTPRTRYGHSHADALSLYIVAGGRTLSTDAGTGSYADDELRDRLRSTFWHSTAWIDDLPHCRPTSRFRWNRVAEARITRWVTSEEMDLVEATHDGYASLSSPVVHHRRVAFWKSRGWRVRDRFEGEGGRTVTVQFVLPFPRERLEMEGELRVRTPAGVIETRSGAGGADAGRLRGELLDLEASPRYGRVETVSAFRATVRARLPVELVSVVTPAARAGMRDAPLGGETGVDLPASGSPLEIG